MSARRKTIAGAAPSRGARRPVHKPRNAARAKREDASDGRGAQRARGAATRNKILDIAEVLFADHGFDGVSIRQITGRAKMPLSQINYHFGSKQGLFVEVIARRAGALNERRLAALADLTGQAAPGAAPSIEQIAECFIRAPLELSAEGGRGWRAYARLIAQLYNTNRWMDVLAGQFNDVAKVYVSAMERALPECRQRDVLYGYQFLLGAMMITFAETERIRHLSTGRDKQESLDEICDRMTKFIAAGFRGLATR